MDINVERIAELAHRIANGEISGPPIRVSIDIEGDPPAPKDVQNQWSFMGLSMGPHDVPYGNVHNVNMVIARHPRLANLIWFDSFHQKYMTMLESHEPREWEERDARALLVYFQKHLGFPRIRQDAVYEGALAFADSNKRNEVKEWMDKQEWDQKPRLDTFFTEYFESEDTPYTRAAARNLWTGMVARAYLPGCQMDHMVILEGKQGIGKTQALRAIGGKWYAEAHESVMTKDFYQVLTGKLLIEIAELDSFTRAEVNKIKQVVSTPCDRFRAPYARAPRDCARTSVFVGSTNEDSYLRDNTGARRFWPIRCGKNVFPALIEDNRKQLFAEAVVAFKKGCRWWEMPEGDTEKEQENRRQSDEWEHDIANYVLGRNEITVKEISRDCLLIQMADLDKGKQMRIAACLPPLGFSRTTLWEDGRAIKKWVRNIEK